MDFFSFIIEFKDGSKYTYDEDIVNNISTLEDLKQQAIEDYIEDYEDDYENEEDPLGVDDCSVSVEAEGNLYSYLADEFSEDTAEDIIYILDQLSSTNYDENQVVAYFECFGIKNFDLRTFNEKSFGDGAFLSNADMMEYYINSFREDIPDDIKSVIDYDAAYTQLGIEYEIVSHNGYYFWY